MKKILIVAAHPDDEVLGCFGAVSRMIKGLNCQKHEAFSLILGSGKDSRGGVSQDEKEILQAEMLKANEVIGIKEVFNGNFPDNAFDSVPILKIIKFIENITQKIKPDIIFTHHNGDMNIDHQITQQAVLTATRPMIGESIKEIYSFYIASSTEWGSYTSTWQPNVFIDVSQTIEDKISAMACYKSELREYPHPRSLEHLRDLAKVAGSKVGLKAAEEFRLLRSIL